MIGLDVVSPCPSNGTTGTFMFVTHRKDVLPKERTETQGQLMSHSAPKTRGKIQPSTQVRVDNIKPTLHNSGSPLSNHCPANATKQALSCSILCMLVFHFHPVLAGSPLALQGWFLHCVPCCAECLHIGLACCANCGHVNCCCRKDIRVNQENRQRASPTAPPPCKSFTALYNQRGLRHSTRRGCLRPSHKLPATDAPCPPPQQARSCKAALANDCLHSSCGTAARAVVTAGRRLDARSQHTGCMASLAKFSADNSRRAHQLAKAPACQLTAQLGSGRGQASRRQPDNG